MKLRVTCLTLAVVATSPLRAQDVEPAAEPKALTKFAWPAPSSVIITETQLKKGRSSKTRYRLEITKREEGGLRIRYRDFQFLEVGGRDVTTPQMQKMLESATAMASAIPDLHISAEGEFEEAAGLDEMLEKLVTHQAKTKGLDEEQTRRLRKQMSSPATKELLAASVGGFWGTWAGSWSDWTTAAGEAEEVDIELPVMGKVVPAKVVIKHLGDAKEHEGCISLSQRVSAEGPKLMTALGGMIKAMAPDLPDEKMFERMTGSFEETMTVVTDPKTLMPRIATSDRTIVVVDNETKEKQEQVERHSYSFDWQ